MSNIDGAFPESLGRTLFSAAVRERQKRFEAEGENGELRIKNEEIRRVAAEGEMSNDKGERLRLRLRRRSRLEA